ncbi:MAG: GPW/gp25 family protein [Firmicutes bacterium]|nr:GPW/gp25 family protein [Bacillota bacterium]
MAIVDFLGKGWRFPVSVNNRQIMSSEAEESIRESIMVILGTAKGERVMRPDFGCGLNELVFAPNDISTATLVTFHVKEALLKWEPRIDLIDVKVVPDEMEYNKLNVEIEYQIKTNNTKANLVYPFYLERAGK